jgi:hypothetical protein
MSEYQAGSPGSDGASSVVTQVQEKVQETTHQLSSSAGQMTSDRIQAQAGQVASELRAVAGALRRSGHALHADGNERSAKIVDAAIDRMESLAGYLAQTNGERMLHDVERFGRRKPWALIGAGMTAGFVASRFLKASSRDRYERADGPQQRPLAAPSVVPPVTTAPPATAPQTIGGAPVTAR